MKGKKIVICILFMLLTSLLSSINVSAEDNSDLYVLESYDIDMVVNENNTFDITEKIGAYFNTNRHGIIRKIPLRNTVTRLDGTVSNNNARITDIYVNDNFKVYIEDGCQAIKIGDPSYTMTGPMDYTISYLYNIGKDPSREYDELYFNLIGNQWDTTVDNISFRITMPKEFDPDKLGFSCGSVHSTDSSDVFFSVQGNVITGWCSKQLMPGEALTVRLELPEGYFTGAGFGVDWMSIASIIVSVLFTLIVFLIWKKYGRDDPVVETVEFYPPAGYNSAEIGFFYKGHSGRKDITSLLIYLANKGYIKIMEDETDTSDGRGKGFRLAKLKEYDGDNELERIFFSGLFKKKNEVIYKDLHYKFYKTLDRIMKKLDTSKYKHKIFQKTSLKKDTPIYAMIAVVFCLITARPLWETNSLHLIIVALLFPSIGIIVSIKGFMYNKTIYKKMCSLFFGCMFAGIPLVIIVLPILLLDPIYFTVYMIGLLCTVCMVVLLNLMPKRTPFGIDILGKIKGFRTFLETAEKPKLEALVMEDPEYFYNILPYTYVLGVSDKWIKKFESITLQEPDWYGGRSSFDSRSFTSFTNNTIDSVTKAMSSSPSSSGGSGGSGGGFSGGGSGGGGGSSW